MSKKEKAEWAKYRLDKARENVKAVYELGIDLKQLELCAGSGMELRWLRGKLPWGITRMGSSRKASRVLTGIRSALVDRINDRIRETQSGKVSYKFALGLVLVNGRWKTQLICSRFVGGILNQDYMIFDTSFGSYAPLTRDANAGHKFRIAGRILT